MLRLLGSLALFACLVAGAVWYVRPPSPPIGYSGLTFTDMTRAASARAPLLTNRGALIWDVDKDSPAARAGIKPGEVMVAIDGVPIRSAAQAAGMVRVHKPGDLVRFSLLDEPDNALKPDIMAVRFETVPPPQKRLSVNPPRAIAKEYFLPPAMAANAAWSRKIQRGPTIRPLALKGLGAGACNGLAPEEEEWEVRGHAADNNMFHIAARAGFMHAIFLREPLNGKSARSLVLAAIEKNFGAKAVAAPEQAAPYGFTLLDYGLARGATGSVLYRAKDGQVSMWIAAVPAADAAWALPLTGAVALTLTCPGPSLPRDAQLPATAVSLRCLSGHCTEADYAAAYLPTLKFGYVHDRAGATWLVRPRKDFWQNGAEGPGFYHQIGGENEKLEPGRTN